MSRSLLFKLARSALFKLPPEKAHELSIKSLQSGLLPTCGITQDGRLQRTIAGLDFPNPIGIAAGYDKNGEVPDAILKMGFGFAEVGTVTPKPQTGNLRPRIFRLVEDEAIINRLGFNNQGHEAVLCRLKARAENGIVGVNIGANKDSNDFVADYIKGIELFAPVASYFTINISSPNTPGLRNLQAKDALQKLLDSVLEKRDALINSVGRKVPVFLKIAPDLDDDKLNEIAAVVNASALEAVIISNTTTDRKVLSSPRRSSHADEQGGLSGKPLFEKSTIVLAKMRQILRADMPIIGVGGVDSAKTAIAKLEAGADLVQLYTGLVYQGPELPRDISRGLGEYLDQQGLNSVAQLTGRKTGHWAGL